VSLTRARKYRTISRTLAPFTALYAAGFAVGTALYEATGHLGLFWGPLGGLRRALLSSPPRHPMPTLDDWTKWIPVVLFGWLFMAELARQQDHRPRGPDRLLLLGYLLLAFATSRTLLSPAVSEAEFLAISTLAGLVLATARWKAWGRSVRLAAAAVVCGAGLLALIVWRVQDSVRLGSG